MTQVKDRKLTESSDGKNTEQEMSQYKFTFKNLEVNLLIINHNCFQVGLSDNYLFSFILF